MDSEGPISYTEVPGRVQAILEAADGVDLTTKAEIMDLVNWLTLDRQDAQAALDMAVNFAQEVMDDLEAVRKGRDLALNTGAVLLEA